MSSFLIKLVKHLYFRFSQLFRIINLSPNTGFAYIFEVVIFIFVKIENNNYYPYIFLIPVLVIHFKRKDIKFLQHVFSNNWKFVLVIENLMFFLFFCVINLYYKIDFQIIFPVLLLILLSLIKIKSSSVIPSLKFNFLSQKYFEINSYLRKNPLRFFLILILLISSGFHPFTLFLYGIFFLDIFSNIYKHNESKEQLTMIFTKQTLKSKIYYNLKFFNIILFFTLIIYILMKNPIYYFLPYLVVVNIFFTLIILRKYSEYFYKKKENEYNTGIYMKYLIVSVLVIPGIYKVAQDYKIAIKNINNYVDNK